MTNKVKRAMDAHLSCLHASVESRNAILERACGGKTMKRKLSLGVVLALVLVLAVIGALAAVILTHKEFADQVLFPWASQSTSQSWTREEMEEILKLAEENGVAVPASVWEDIEHGMLYKEEIIRVFAKAQLGFYPSTWSIEDQAWYSRMLVESGLTLNQNSVVPQGNEISQEEALKIVQDYIRTAYDENADVEDTSVYRRHMTYQEYKVNPYDQGRQWFIEYEPLDPAHSHYTFTLLSDGRVISSRREYGLTEKGGPELRPDEVLSKYQDAYGENDTWTLETWVSFRETLASAARIYGLGGGGSGSVLVMQKYALPDSASITREAAEKAAREAVIAGGAAVDMLEKSNKTYAVYLLDEDAPVWKVTFFMPYQEQNVRSYWAELDARTGAVRDTGVYARTDSWYRPYILDSIAPKTQMVLPDVQPQSTPRPDGMPRIWRSGIAPDYFWEALDAVGYNSETGAGLMAAWEEKYGWNNIFWPLEYQAIDEIWHGISSSATVLPGLPAPGDISQEKALEVAWKALREENGKKYGAAFLDGLKAAVSFTFNTPEMGRRAWLIRFVEITPLQSNVLESVSIDAVTGDVIEASWIESVQVDAPPIATLAPGEKPVLWRSDLAPDSFWDQLEALGYNSTNAQEFEAKWAKEYGEDRAFWPLIAKAATSLWDDPYSKNTYLFGVPGEGDMTEEQAVALAEKILNQGYADIYGKDFLKDLHLVVDFMYGMPQKGSTAWRVQFVEATSGNGVFYATVLFNAKTGEIIDMEVARGNG